VKHDRPPGCAPALDAINEYPGPLWYDEHGRVSHDDPIHAHPAGSNGLDGLRAREDAEFR
jgi:hypothetical protein